MNQVTKYMCTVVTKNYPVNTIRPTIQRYSSIKKKLNATEIASCLASYATVTLHKNNGACIKLTAANFKNVLLEYKNELLHQQEKNKMNAEIKKNAEALNEIREEVKTTANTVASETVEIKSDEEKTETVNETETLEEFEVDPEDPDTADFSNIDTE